MRGVIVRYVGRGQQRVLHFFGEQVKHCVSVAEEHVETRFAAHVVPGAALVIDQPVGVPGRIAANDLVERADADFAGFDGRTEKSSMGAVTCLTRNVLIANCVR